jgi:hypothetical protein
MSKKNVVGVERDGAVIATRETLRTYTHAVARVETEASRQHVVDRSREDLDKARAKLAEVKADPEAYADRRQAELTSHFRDKTLVPARTSGEAWVVEHEKHVANCENSLAKAEARKVGDVHVHNYCGSLRLAQRERDKHASAKFCREFRLSAWEILPVVMVKPATVNA